MAVSSETFQEWVIKLPNTATYREEKEYSMWIVLAPCYLIRYINDRLYLYAYKASGIAGLLPERQNNLVFYKHGRRIAYMTFSPTLWPI